MLKNLSAMLIGAKSYPLNALTEDEQIRRLFGGQGSDTISEIDAYKAVAWLYRAIDVRSKAVQGVPFKIVQGKRDLTNSPRVQSLLKNFKRNLGLVESSLCLYGQCYLIREKNTVGTNEQLRWLLPTTITPKLDSNAGLTGFTRTLNQQKIPLGLEQIVYFWQPSLEHEIGPGIGPAHVALRSAAVLHNLDTYLEGYFERGAIRATLLTIEGNPPPSDKQRLEAWWKKLVGGVKKAHETVALSGSVKPTVIGDGIKDTTSPDLVTQARQDIMTALGVPHSLLESDSANFATASIELLSFYQNTILPELELVAEVFNEQLFGPLGFELVFEPQKLEVFQAAELQKAEAVSKLVGKPILTLNEGRDLMGYEPLDEPPPPVPQMPPPISPGDAHASTEPPIADQAKALDLDRWQRKSIKSLSKGKGANVSFESDYIGEALAERISAGLAEATTPDGIKAVFDEL